MNSKDKKIVWSIVLVWSIPIICAFTLAYFAFLQHDFYLWQLQRSVATINNPPNTKSIASAKDIGLLVANGNHCDYFVAQLRSFPENMTSKQIQLFYKNSKIWNPLNRRTEIVSIGVIKNGRIESNEAWTGISPFLQSYFHKNLPRQLKDQHFYFVFVLDIGNAVACDIRCV
jgi:hypothetical protein